MTTDGTYRIARILRKLTLGFLLVALCPAAGVLAGDGVVALQTAEASCGAGSPASTVYVDCGNGTVTDRRTGLVWLANADCLGGTVDWSTAMESVAGLADLDGGACAFLTEAECDCGLSDGSSPGEWRLPSAAEWQAMVADAVGLGCSPTITSDFPAGVTACWTGGCSNIGLCAFSDVQSAFYWSASPFVVNPSSAWVAGLDTGVIGPANKFITYPVWPVRGGQ